MQNFIIIVFAFILIMWLMNKKVEGYNTVSIGNRYGRTDPYFSFRLYNHDPYHFHKYGEKCYDYPWNYMDRPFYKRYHKYNPYFHHYGYGY